MLIVSLEDDRDELRRRVYAVLRHHGLTPADVRGWLFLSAPKGLRLAEMRNGAPVAGELETLLRSAIEQRKVDVVSIDPFIKSHGLVENDNGAIDLYARCWRRSLSSSIVPSTCRTTRRRAPAGQVMPTEAVAHPR